MSNMELVEKREIEGGDKLNKIMNRKLLKNQKGFSLVELLIVIAIMGVLAVIAFNMFGGVLTSSKKRADDQQAEMLGRAVLAYCIETNDWKLEKAWSNASPSVDLNLDGSKPKAIFQALSKSVLVGSKEYGPYITLKDPTKAATATENESVFVPQWSRANGGEYVGWDLTVFAKSQTVKCVPKKYAAAVPGVGGAAGTPEVSDESNVTIDLAN